MERLLNSRHQPSTSDAELPRFATLSFVGPGSHEAGLLRRLLVSLQQFEPEVATVVIIDDSSKQDFSKIIPASLQSRAVILPNPRNGKWNWWQGGLCTGLATGLQWLSRQPELQYVVRLDSDALIIGPFSKSLGAILRADHQIGLVGTWDKYAYSGEARLPHPATVDVMSTIVKKSLRPVAIWRQSDAPIRFQCSLRRRDRLIRRLMTAALANGYSYGDFVQGGSYAISAGLLKSARAAGFLEDPLAYVRQPFGEDHLATFLCFAAGLMPHSCNQRGEIFGVGNVGLPAPLEKLKEVGYAIVHSIKELEPEG